MKMQYSTVGMRALLVAGLMAGLGTAGALARTKRSTLSRACRLAADLLPVIRSTWPASKDLTNTER